LCQDIDTIIGAFSGQGFLQAFVELRHPATDLFQMARLPSTNCVSMALRIFHDGRLDAIVTQEEDGLLSSTCQSKDGVGEFWQLMAWATLDLQ